MTNNSVKIAGLFKQIKAQNIRVHSSLLAYAQLILELQANLPKTAENKEALEAAILGLKSARDFLNLAQEEINEVHDKEQKMIEGQK